jgi:hypothetical protein
MRATAMVLMAMLGLACSDAPMGNATTADEEDVVLFALSLSDTFLTVYTHNSWTLTDNSECKASRGEVTGEERTKLDSYMTDESFAAIKGQCSGETYSFRAKGTDAPVCWAKGDKGPAIEGLASFYEDKVAKLAEVPKGKCGGTQGLTPAAGSFAP